MVEGTDPSSLQYPRNRASLPGYGVCRQAQDPQTHVS